MDLSKWAKVPGVLIVVGGLGALMGAIIPSLREQFAFSWLVAFMFYLSLGLGALFFVMVHHLFDASWSVPIRRYLEHLANLLPWMILLFIPLAIFAPKVYGWMTLDPHAHHALAAKQPLLSVPGFYIVSLLCLGVWWLLASRLRYWSVRQDETGEAECTYKMRLYSYWGIFAFAATVTLGSIMWVKSLNYHWFSTIYGVYYFAGSVWMTAGVAYIIGMILKQQGPLRDVIQPHVFYYIGSILFAFTVFYAYIHFSQYFIIWNANLPEETFWYQMRESGNWMEIGLLIIFGHFFLPFLALLRIDLKMTFWWMFCLGIWGCLMHFCDIAFNVMPLLHPDGFVLHWLDLACLAFMGGLLAKIYLRELYSGAWYPQKDPRLAEALGVYVPSAAERSGSKA